jgi:tetratricopeptide (TPR) repeat protein
VKLTEGEQARVWARGTENPKAYEKGLQALEYFRLFTPDGNTQARQVCEKALELDPEYTLVLVTLAWTHLRDVFLGWSKFPGQSIARAAELAQKALAVDDSSAGAHALLANIHLMKRQHEKAIATGERAVALSPNEADNIALLGMILRYSGRPEEAIELSRKAIRLNPMPPNWYLHNLGFAYCMTGQYEEAIELFKKVLHHNPDHFTALLVLAATYSLAGHEEEARATAAEVIRVNPKFSLESFAKTTPFRNQADTERIVGALRKAGLK